jgi:hypothetical protein
LDKEQADEKDAIINKELTYDSADFIQDYLIVFNKQLMCLTEFLQKINTVMYLQRAQREHREKTEKILVFFGSLSAKLALPMSNELTTGL